MQDYMKRHLELHIRRRRQYVIEDGQIFRPYNRLARPLGPICLDYTISAEGARRVINALGTLGVVTTDGIDCSSSEAWYGTVNDQFVPFSDMSKNHRKQVRRALKSCEVRRVEPAHLAEAGYDVYARAFERYRPPAQPSWSPTQFAEYLRSAAGYDDIVHCWGAVL